jgi:hypothetical protein
MLVKCLLKRFGMVLAFGGLGACSTPFLAPLAEPEPQAIVDYVALFGPFAKRPIETGGDYVWAGYTYVDHHCTRFFRVLEDGRAHLAFAKNTASSAFGAANTVLTLLKESQTSIGIVGAAGTLIGATINSYSNDFYYNQFSSVSQYGGSLWLQTTIAQSDYKFRNDVIRGLYSEISGAPIAVVEIRAKAHNIVQNYARLCTIQQMQVFINTALNSKPATPAADHTPITPNSKHYSRPSGRSDGGGMSAYIIR